MPRPILFVDDERGVLDLLAATFPASAGWEPLSASSGEEALAVLATRQVDLLVTDQRMPGMTGVELIARARQLQPDLCAIVLSAYTEPQDVVAAINQGQVYRYVVKPWETRELRRTVEQALERVYLQREREKLTDELERRFAALQVASEIAREVEPAGDHEALVTRLLSKLPGVVPCDRAAALVAPPGRAAVMVLERRGHAGEDSLLLLKEDVLQAWREGGGRPIAEGDLRLRVVGAFGPDIGDSCFAGRVRGFAGDVDGELVLGWRAQDLLAGFTTSARLGGAAAHAELAYFHLPAPLPPGAGGAQNVLKAVLGASYSFRVGNGLPVWLEYHYSGFGVKQAEQVIPTLADPAYNMVFHQAPNPALSLKAWPDIDHNYHWHIEIFPILTKVAGFEWGTGYYINPVPPETAATFLRA